MTGKDYGNDPLVSRFIKTLNTWIRYESVHKVYKHTSGITKWWYSPSTGAMLPGDDPMNASRRAGGHLLGVDDWIFLATTMDGELTVQGHQEKFEEPEDFWLT